MLQALKDRLAILKTALPHPALLAAFGVLQVAWVALKTAALPSGLAPLAQAAGRIPASAWAVAWLLLLLFSSLEYSLKRKRKFDRTSANFFRAYLDFLLQQGQRLFERSQDKDFYSHLNDWQHRALEGLAIGMGPEASGRFFEKMDREHPLTVAFRESQQRHSNEPLCAWLSGHLEELRSIRATLEGPRLLEQGEEGPKRKPAGERDPGEPRDPGGPPSPGQTGLPRLPPG